MFKFIHAADLHLDSPLRGLEAYEGAPVQEIRGAARRALTNLVDLAIEEEVAFVVIAGDIYDGDWRSVNTGLFFVGQANRLHEAGIPLFLIAGNHDAANKMTKSLLLPESTTFFSSSRPETVELEDWNVAIHGQSFATAAVTADLSAKYPKAVPGRFNLGILHTCATGKEGHASYAPCTIEGLRQKEYDYWALGHIHLRETLCESPYVAFSGNLQGRHIRESGAKGLLLVTVDQDAIQSVEFRAVDVLRWEQVRVNLSGATTFEEALDRLRTALEQAVDASEGRPLAARVSYIGASALHDTLQAKRASLVDETRSVGNSLRSGGVWIEKVQLKTSPLQTSSGEEGIADSALAELIDLFDQLRPEPELIETFGADCLGRLPADLKEELVAADPEWIQGVITEARSRLIGSLRNEEVGS